MHILNPYNLRAFLNSFYKNTLIIEIYKQNTLEFLHVKVDKKLQIQKNNSSQRNFYHYLSKCWMSWEHLLTGNLNNKQQTKHDKLSLLEGSFLELGNQLITHRDRNVKYTYTCARKIIRLIQFRIVCCIVSVIFGILFTKMQYGRRNDNASSVKDSLFSFEHQFSGVVVSTAPVINAVHVYLTSWKWLIIKC